MPLPNDLTPEAREEIDRQAARIAELGDAWQPTSQNLQTVVEAVFQAQRGSWKDSQTKGIESARKRGVNLGRPRLAEPVSAVQDAWGVSISDGAVTVVAGN